MAEIHTERLVLRNPRAEDKAALTGILNDWEVSRWLVKVPYPFAEADAEAWLETAAEQPLKLLIVYENQLAGGVTMVPKDDAYELGCWLGRDYWRKGIAKEASEGLLNYAAKTMSPPVKLYARYVLGHPVSDVMLPRLGFVESGRGEDYVLSHKKTLPVVSLTRMLHTPE